MPKRRGIPHTYQAAMFPIDPEQAATDNRPGLALKDAPATSKQAAAAIEPKSGTQRGRVLETLRSQPDWGCTREEIANQMGIPLQSVNPRIAELRGLGLVEVSNATRLTVSRKKASVLFARCGICGRRWHKLGRGGCSGG